MTVRIPAHGSWRTNAEMVADVAKLGHFDGTVLDVTYGKGNFWTKWRPDHLITNDLFVGTPDLRADCLQLPFADRSVDVVVIDLPYRLNGTPDQEFDEAYGIDEYTDWRDRIALLVGGAAEGARVAGRRVVMKCQDQVVSGKKRFQIDAITDAVTGRGFRKFDLFTMPVGVRKQTGRQVHANSNRSTLLVFARGKVDNG